MTNNLSSARHPHPVPHTIAFVYNTATYLLNLRGPLIRTLLESGMRVIAIAPRDDAFEVLRSMGVETVDWRVEGHGINPLRDLASYHELKKRLAQTRPDIVFNFTIKPVIYGSIAARAVGCKKIFSMIPGRGYVFGTGSLRQRVFRTIVLPLYRRALKNNRKVFFQNTHDRDYFVSHGLAAPGQTVVVDGSGVDTEYFAPSSERAPDAAFLLIARLLAEKGVAEYAAAAQSLKRRHPHARFFLLGPFSEAPSALTRQEVARWQSEGGLEYLGQADDVRPHIARCGVFVLPSYYNEGLPRTVLEAMSMAKAIVTTDWPGCRETVEAGENGFLVPVRDAEALEAAMERFIDNPELASAMGDRSREIACTRFDVHRVNGQLIDQLLT